MPSRRHALARPVKESNRSPPRTHISHPASQRKKGIGIRTWLVIDSSGRALPISAGKHSIMRRTGLSAHDLRILDPLLSYRSAIMGRERAIVINLQHVKGIITAQDVSLLNFKDPVVAPFAEKLQRRLSDYQQAIPAEVSKAGGREEEQTEELQYHKLKTLPFEFVVLETCLDSVCSYLDGEVKTFELEAYPAMDKLTSKLSTSHLERVRQIKGRLVSVTGRNQKIKDEIEHLLENEGVLVEMHLTEKINQEGHDHNSHTLPAAVDRNKDEHGGESDKREEEEEEDDDEGEGEDDGEIELDEGLTGNPHASLMKHVDVLELEMLLEAYLVRVEVILNKLSTLKEYVDGTEDYVRIMLDEKQNILLQTMVLLSMGALVLTIPNIWSGFLASRVDNAFFHAGNGYSTFSWVAAGNVLAPISIFLVFYAWFKMNYL